jgi:hypothetical protein
MEQLADAQVHCKSREPLTMPVGDVLVGNAGCDVEHDDAALAVDIVSIAQASEFLLSRGIPDIELNVAQVLRVCQSTSLFVESVDGRTVLNPKG